MTDIIPYELTKRPDIPVPRVGDLYTMGTDPQQYKVFVGHNKTGAALFAAVEKLAGNLRPTFEAVPGNRMGLERKYTLPQKRVHEWGTLFRTDSTHPDPIDLGAIDHVSRNRLVTAARAYDLLLNTPRDGNQPPKKRVFPGDFIKIGNKTFTTAYVYSEGYITLARYDPGTDAVEFAYAKVQDLDLGARTAGTWNLPSDYIFKSSVRHTRDLTDQPARLVEAIGRPYYRAGGKIDGSVVQYTHDSEILVVDFGEDRELLRFYSAALEEYEKVRIRNPAKSMFEYFFEIVRDNTVYDVQFVDGLITGETQEGLQRNPQKFAALAARCGGIDKLKKAMKLAPLKNGKVQVGTYLTLGVAVCRQQATIVAACMERAIRESRDRGEWLGVEIRGNVNDPGGHAWAVGLRRDGQVFVTDSTQNFYGREDAGSWNYRLGYENHRFGQPGT